MRGVCCLRVETALLTIKCSSPTREMIVELDEIERGPYAKSPKCRARPGTTLSALFWSAPMVISSWSKKMGLNRIVTERRMPSGF